MKKMKDNKDYIIVEIIPTTPNPETGEIVQISALLLHGLELVDRFDYRLDMDKIYIPDLVKMLNYDIDKFRYLPKGKDILEKFKEWSKNTDLLMIDNDYTIKYLQDLPNKKESIFKYLGLKYTDEVIDKVIQKYHLEPSNYIVDLLYEALIYESNNK